ncbi:SDR family oxidoreductase [Solimonas marina]|uniref:SDR family oxidoreductase n=1 Tax=Solimonas marina TaxID=2714601 RepID=A0A969W8Y5_9GAMM|nr:SDR family oxidoreductase [Solimonas marina]NKF22817.1 SDR family oxidoreductase [Solimonas marina]
MKLNARTVLLTGASGGIGQALAREFAQRGAHLLLSARNVDKLATLGNELRALGIDVSVLSADLSSADGAERLAHAALSGGTPDLVVHCAGSMSFGCLETIPTEEITQLWQTNVIAPSLLTRALLPALRKQGHGRLVFVGSIFGSLAFPMYATYSATKFALRGFAEALRRELDGSGIGVTYVAPRYTRTPMNDGAPARIAQALSMQQDEPAMVARRIADAIERDRRDLFFGFGERIFVKLNAWFPWLVDRGLRAQTRRMRELEPATAGLPQ